MYTQVITIMIVIIIIIIIIIISIIIIIIITTILNIYIYIYIHICVCMYVYIYIYITHIIMCICPPPPAPRRKLPVGVLVWQDRRDRRARRGRLNGAQKCPSGEVPLACGPLGDTPPIRSKPLLGPYQAPQGNKHEGHLGQSSLLCLSDNMK